MERMQILVTVKAYPAVSSRYGETVCVAGIRMDDPARPRWIRLYPVLFRELEDPQRFKKYQVISLDAAPHGTDQRPESYRPNPDSLQLGRHIKTRNGRWDERCEWVEPLVVPSMCWLLEQQRENDTSLGAFRPSRVLDVIVEDAEPWSSDKAAIAEYAAQPTLFGPGRKALEQVPYRFSYRYMCAADGCNGHKQSIIDWELGEAWRSWNYPDAEKAERIRDRWLNVLCGPDRDPIFFVGNQHQYPRGFIVLGVFWPPRDPDPADEGQFSLFDE